MLPIYLSRDGSYIKNPAFLLYPVSDRIAKSVSSRILNLKNFNYYEVSYIRVLFVSEIVKKNLPKSFNRLEIRYAAGYPTSLIFGPSLIMTTESGKSGKI